jgi:hypothetical protein
LARYFKFLNPRRTRVTGNSDGPYHHGSNGNAELVTIGGTGGKGSRQVSNKKGTPDDSEEELVYYNNDMNKEPIKDHGIMKKTEFAVSERTESPAGNDDQSHQKRMKPWEGYPHAL